MADKTVEEMAKLLSQRPTELRLRGLSTGPQSVLRSLLESVLRALEERGMGWTSWEPGALHSAPHPSLPYYAAYTTMPQATTGGESDAVSQLEAAQSIFEETAARFSEALKEAAARVSEDLKLAEQVRAQLEEVDDIIERLRNDREDIDRLKKETRSNISELQRMIAA